MGDNNADLNIVLKLIDEATGQLKKTLGEIENATDKVGSKGKKSGDSLAQGFKTANKQLRDFRQMMLVAGVAVGAIVATTREWANSNAATSNALNSLTMNTKLIAGNIGSLLAPAIIGIADALRQVMPALTEFFDKAREGFSKLNEWVTYGVQWWVSYAAAIRGGASAQEAYGIAANVAAAAAQASGEKFQEAFKTDTTAEVNALDQALNKLGQTWASWTDETTQGDMISMTTQAAAMQQSIAAYQEYHTTVAQLNQLSNDQELQSFLKMTAQKKQALDDLMKKITMTTQQHMALLGAELGQLSSALAGMSEQGRGWAEAAKAVATGQAIINMHEGITKAWAQGGLWGAVGAAIVAAACGIQIAAIQSQKFATGTDSVPAMLTPGEMVIPRSFSEAIRQGNLSLSGPSGTTNNSSVKQVYIDIKVDRPTVSQASDVDYLVEEISRRVAQEVERIR